MADEVKGVEPGRVEPAKQPAAAGSYPETSSPPAQVGRTLAGLPLAQAAALVVAGVTLILLFVGGIVTSSGAGMSVPDWPTSFGHNMFSLPFDLWKGPGVAIEHSHRLLGTTVGILAILAVVASIFGQRRGVVQATAFAVLILVCVQGGLGGMRVLLAEHGLAPIHGSFAQLVFAVMAAFVTVAGAGWITSQPLSVPAEALRKVRTKAWIVVGLCYLQVLLGAWYRHSATGARIEPHAMNALAIIALAGITTKGVRRLAPGRPWLSSTGKLLNALLGVQLLLGVAALFAKPSAIHVDVKLALASAHIVLGALVLGLAVSFALKLHRDLQPGARDLEPGAPSPISGEQRPGEKLAGASS